MSTAEKFEIAMLARSAPLEHEPAWTSIPEVAFFNTSGDLISQAAFEAWFTAELDILRAEAIPGFPTLRLAAVYARDSDATQIVRILDADGNPISGVAVGRWWPGAPGLDPYPPDCFATRWKDRCVVGWTKENGDVGYGMGHDDCPPGSSGVWPIHCQAPADWIGGLGWAPGVAHKTAFPVFVLVNEEDEPPDEWEDLVLKQLRNLNNKARRQIELQEHIVELLENW